MTFLFRLCVVLLPWIVRRHVLRGFYGYELHPTARIGCSWIFPRKLVMRERARIGHLNVAIHLECMELGAHVLIDRANWITGFPRGNSGHFAHCTNREPSLVLGAHSAVTKNHHIDCTDRIEVGAFTTIAGYASQLLTHGIDLERNRQDAAPITIGDHCFVGTAVVILAGARLPSRSVLGAKALLNKAHELEGQLYAGVPAKAIQPIPADAEYFRRTMGFVA
jgi:acetyltransferase-like isoleucine patch superfamily enzyme